jgi:hypothetical protein
MRLLGLRQVRRNNDHEAAWRASVATALPGTKRLISSPYVWRREWPRCGAEDCIPALSDWLQQLASPKSERGHPKIYAHIHRALNGGVSQSAASELSTPAQRLA